MRAYCVMCGIRIDPMHTHCKKHGEKRSKRKTLERKMGNGKGRKKGPRR